MGRRAARRGSPAAGAAISARSSPSTKPCGAPSCRSAAWGFRSCTSTARRSATTSSRRPVTQYPKRVYVRHVRRDRPASQQGENAIGVLLGNGRYYSPRSEVVRGDADATGSPSCCCTCASSTTTAACRQLVSDDVVEAVDRRTDRRQQRIRRRGVRRPQGAGRLERRPATTTRTGRPAEARRGADAARFGADDRPDPRDRNAQADRRHRAAAGRVRRSTWGRTWSAGAASRSRARGNAGDAACTPRRCCPTATCTWPTSAAPA